MSGHEKLPLHDFMQVRHVNFPTFPFPSAAFEALFQSHLAPRIGYVPSACADTEGLTLEAAGFIPTPRRPVQMSGRMATDKYGEGCLWRWMLPQMCTIRRSDEVAGRR